MSFEETVEQLKWKKYNIGSHGFVCLVSAYEDETAITEAAKTSYGNDLKLNYNSPDVQAKLKELFPNGSDSHYSQHTDDGLLIDWSKNQYNQAFEAVKKQNEAKDITLIRYLMRMKHSSCFEMCEVKLLVHAPIHIFRQWIRHRTFSLNEYSMRYSKAIDEMETTNPDAWRLQSKNNKQGSDGILTDWPENYEINTRKTDGLETAGEYLSFREKELHEHAKEVYEERLNFGIAKEQARKDLPLSTYSEAYMKVDLHNMLHFLSLRMDSHAQLEIRDFANAIGDIVKQLYPNVWKAFEDYRLNAISLTALDIAVINKTMKLSDIKNKREREECISKLERLNLTHLLE